LTKPELSIIIATHNSQDYVERCIQSLVTQSFPRKKFEIIIVDDSSTDNSVEIAKKTGADKIIQTKPCSVAKARNIGVENADSDLLAFFDSDCEAEDGWISTIIKELKKLEAITGPIENGNTHSKEAWAEYFVEFGGFHKYRNRSIVRFLTGCSGACTKQAYTKAGGYKDLRASDDVLFGESLRKAGIQAFFIPQMCVKHLSRTDWKKVKANMKLLGKYFVRTRREEPSIPYSFLIKNRALIPLIFFWKNRD